MAVYPSFETFLPSIAAFASTVVPQDPAVPAALGVPDGDTGQLARPTIAPYSDPFGMEIIRWYRVGKKNLFFPEEGSGEVAGLQFFTELNLQAMAYGFPDFAALYAVSPAGALGLVQGCFFGGVTPISPETGGSAGLRFLTTVAASNTMIIWSNNMPENRQRTNLAGWGWERNAPVVYSDPANLIANPNNRVPQHGGTATYASRSDYSSLWQPVRNEAEEAIRLSMLDWQDPASDAQFASLLVAIGTGDMMDLN